MPNMDIAVGSPPYTQGQCGPHTGDVAVGSSSTARRVPSSRRSHGQRWHEAPTCTCSRKGTRTKKSSTLSEGGRSMAIASSPAPPCKHRPAATQRAAPALRQSRYAYQRRGWTSWVAPQSTTARFPSGAAAHAVKHKYVPRYVGRSHAASWQRPMQQTRVRVAGSIVSSAGAGGWPSGCAP